MMMTTTTFLRKLPALPRWCKVSLYPELLCLSDNSVNSCCLSLPLSCELLESRTIMSISPWFLQHVIYCWHPEDVCWLKGKRRRGEATSKVLWGTENSNVPAPQMESRQPGRQTNCGLLFNPPVRIKYDTFMGKRGRSWKNVFRFYFFLVRYSIHTGMCKSYM